MITGPQPEAADRLVPSYEGCPPETPLKPQVRGGGQHPTHQGDLAIKSQIRLRFSCWKAAPGWSFGGLVDGGRFWGCWMIEVAL